MFANRNLSNCNIALLANLLELKSDNNVNIIDCHVHPMDVMGVHHHSNHKFYDLPNIDSKIFTEPSLIERFQLGGIVNIIANYYCKIFPDLVNDEISEKYSITSKKRILKEMDMSLIDEAILVPLEPIINTEHIYSNFNHNRFHLLGSIDVRGIQYEEISEKIHRYISDYNIIGLKLHPNLQDFFPIPSDNDVLIEKKLTLIYKLCEDNNLFILFHAGTSFFTNDTDARYGQVVRSRSKALLTNYFYDKSKTIFDDFNVSFILAHLGHYGVNKFHEKEIEILSKKKNIFFDTAGTSPKLIVKMMAIVGYEKIIFGSDAIYNKQLFSVISLCKAIWKIYGELPLEVVKAVFYQNIYKLMIK